MCYSGTCYFENHMGECNNLTYAYTIAEEIGKPCIIGGFKGEEPFTEEDIRLQKVFSKRLKNFYKIKVNSK